jgi:CBS domain-containing protein
MIGDKTVAELMTTNVFTARIEDTIDLADIDMKLARIRHIPVVDGNRIIGIVSDRDILRAFGALGDNSLIIGAVMSDRVQTIDERAPAREALRIMLDGKIGCLPVTGDDGALVGVITETDFMRLLYDSPPDGS